MTTDASASLQASVPGDWVGAWWQKLGRTISRNYCTLTCIT